MEDLPPGFRFYPTEEELVSFYLQNKLEGRREDLNRVMERVIPVLYIYEYNPWDLPQFSGEACHGDPEQWFFFIPRQESEARGGRPRRLTTTGYWKATGSPSFVYSSNSNRAIGLKRTMVFYNGRAPHGRKTEWKMNEYKAIEAHHADQNQPLIASSSSNTPSAPTLRQEFSLCRVYKKSKCLRAFDRRPLGVEIMSNSSLNLNQTAAAHEGEGHRGQGSASHSRNPLMGSDQRTNSSSPESSSSGDHHGPQPPSQPAGETGTLPMFIDNEALWDLEQLMINNNWL
ncbi:unnamed protein product [Prunus brigantina]